MNTPESLRGSGPEPALAYAALTYSGAHAARAGGAGRPPPRRKRRDAVPERDLARLAGREVRGPVVVQDVSEQRAVWLDLPAPQTAEDVVQREERGVGSAPEDTAHGVV